MSHETGLDPDLQEALDSPRSPKHWLICPEAVAEKIRREVRIEYLHEVEVDWSVVLVTVEPNGRNAVVQSLQGPRE